MQFICIGVCVVLAILIAVLIITGRNRREEKAAPAAENPVTETVESTAEPVPETEESSPFLPAAETPEDTPETEPEDSPAEQAETPDDGESSPAEEEEQAEATPTPKPETSDYPSKDVRDEIAGADLDVYPEEEDYVTEDTRVTVSTNGSDLNVRQGPGSNYSLVTTVDNGTSLPVYAYRNGWGLVKTDGVWGWCSKDYLD